MTKGTKKVSNRYECVPSLAPFSMNLARLRRLNKCLTTPAIPLREKGLDSREGGITRWKRLRFLLWMTRQAIASS